MVKTIWNCRLQKRGKTDAAAAGGQIRDHRQGHLQMGAGRVHPRCADPDAAGGAF